MSAFFFFLTLHYIMCVWANNKPAPPSASQRSLQQRLAVPCLLGSVQEWLGNTNPWNWTDKCWSLRKRQLCWSSSYPGYIDKTSCLRKFNDLFRYLTITAINIRPKVLRESPTLDKTCVQVSIYKNGTKAKQQTFISFTSEAYTGLWGWRNAALYVKPANSRSSDLALIRNKRWSHSSTDMGWHNSQCLPF